MIIIDKLIIYIFCILLSIKECGGDNTIVLALVFLSLTSFYMVANKDKMKDILIMEMDPVTKAQPKLEKIFELD